MILYDIICNKTQPFSQLQKPPAPRGFSWYGICHPSQQRQLVNTAVRSVLPFDPDASDLPVAWDLGWAKMLSAGGWEPKIGEKLYWENEGFLIWTTKVGIEARKMKRWPSKAGNLQQEWWFETKTPRAQLRLGQVWGNTATKQEGQAIFGWSDPVSSIPNLSAVHIPVLLAWCSITIPPILLVVINPDVLSTPKNLHVTPCPHD